jgi:hypothetical protein
VKPQNVFGSKQPGFLLAGSPVHRRAEGEQAGESESALVAYLGCRRIQIEKVAILADRLRHRVNRRRKLPRGYIFSVAPCAMDSMKNPFNT